MINELLLLSKNDIPFTEARVNIHQPTIKEISFISEKSFHTGVHLLNFSKNKLSEKDKSDLRDKTDFEVFMSVMNSKDKFKVDALMVLTLLFPHYQIKVEKDKISLINEEMSTSINYLNFDGFKEIIVKMFELEDFSSETGEYNPADKFAEKIAEKLKKRQAKIAKQKGEDKKEDITVFSRYVSILAVGEQKDINTLMDYTVFQLKDEFKRFQKKQDFDMYIKAKMAGATDIEEVDNWMDNIHP